MADGLERLRVLGVFGDDAAAGSGGAAAVAPDLPRNRVGFVEEAEQHGGVVRVAAGGIEPEPAVDFSRRLELVQIENHVAAGIGGLFDELVAAFAVGGRAGAAGGGRVGRRIGALALMAEPEGAVDGHADDVRMPVVNRLIKGEVHLIALRVPFERGNGEPLQPEGFAFFVADFVSFDGERLHGEQTDSGFFRARRRRAGEGTQDAGGAATDSRSTSVTGIRMCRVGVLALAMRCSRSIIAA